MACMALAPHAVPWCSPPPTVKLGYKRLVRCMMAQVFLGSELLTPASPAGMGVRPVAACMPTPRGLADGLTHERIPCSRPHHSVRVNTAAVSAADMVARVRETGGQAQPSRYLPLDFVRLDSGLQQLVAEGAVSQGLCRVGVGWLCPDVPDTMPTRANALASVGCMLMMLLPGTTTVSRACS